MMRPHFNIQAATSAAGCQVQEPDLAAGSSCTLVTFGGVAGGGDRQDRETWRGAEIGSTPSSGPRGHSLLLDAATAFSSSIPGRN